MKRCIVLILLCLAFSACRSHHYRTEEDHVMLILKYQGARKVVLFCSLDGFKPKSAKNVSGNWESAVQAGEIFRYFYRVDGILFVPDCPMKEKDDFGFENCIYDPHL